METAIKVLVVDDTLLIREMARKLLEGSGYQVQCAGDGTEARAVWASWEPDVVLLDLIMPGENGWEVLASLREELTARTVVFMFSGDDDLTESDARERGAAGVIRKPFTADVLLSRLKTAAAPSGRAQP